VAGSHNTDTGILCASLYYRAIWERLKTPEELQATAISSGKFASCVVF
jgi:hypothetical protein